MLREMHKIGSMVWKCWVLGLVVACSWAKGSPVDAKFKSCLFRETCADVQYQRTRYSCCRTTPIAITCCRRNVGISEKVAAVAQDMVHCGKLGNKTALTRTSPFQKCCGNQLFDSQTECCVVKDGGLEKHPIQSDFCKNKPVAAVAQDVVHCGKLGNKTALTRTSRFQKCCGNQLFDSQTECCVVKDGGLEKHPIQSDFCKNKPVAAVAQDVVHCGKLGNKTALTRTSRFQKCCGNQLFDSQTECCVAKDGGLEKHPIQSDFCKNKPVAAVAQDVVHCGKLGNKTALTRTSRFQKCCGNQLFDSQTECCVAKDGGLEKHPIQSDFCKNKPVAAVAQDVVHCGKLGNKTALTRTSRFQKCCGNQLFDSQTECCVVKDGGLEKHPIQSDFCKKKSESCLT